MNKQTTILVLSSLFLLIGLSTGAYLLLETQKSESSTTQKKPSVDVSLKESRPAKENQEQSNTLQVQGAETQTSKKQQLLSPDDFNQYEQFTEQQTAQYQDEIVGSGQEALNGDTIAVVYKGWLTDGTLFDQSKVNEQNLIEPFVLKLGDGQVITGWEQGIIGMKEGGKRRLIIPSALAYGEAGRDPIIPPNSMLIFDIELVQVQKP